MYENVNEKGDVLKTLRFWCEHVGEKEDFEKGDVDVEASIYTTPGHSCFHSFRGFNSSVDRQKQYNNVSVDENIFCNVSGQAKTDGGF